LAGVAALTGGAVALFTTDNGAASIFLLTLGVVLVLIAWLGPRVELESFELLGAKIRVREIVAHRLRLAEAEAAEPLAGNGEAPHRQAASLQRLDGLYRLYTYIRRTQPFSIQRTRDLDTVAARMQAVGRETKFDPVEVATWFQDGDDALRVVALNIMLAREDCRDFVAALQAIDEPHSNFEQYYGLRLVKEMKLDQLERQLVAGAIARAQRTKRFQRDTDLVKLSNKILTSLQPAPGQ
jgi:hypothetical protein